MRLLDLSPRWFDVPGTGTDKDGVTFLCPHCREVRLAVQFANPVDAEPKPLMSNKDQRRHVHDLGTFDVPPGTLWGRTGETFETLTLNPSVDASQAGHWHGWIRNGEAV